MGFMRICTLASHCVYVSATLCQATVQHYNGSPKLIVGTVITVVAGLLTGVISHTFSVACIPCRIKDLAAHLQFIQDISGAEVMHGDMGLAFKICKDFLHKLLQTLT